MQLFLHLKNIEYVFTPVAWKYLNQKFQFHYIVM